MAISQALRRQIQQRAKNCCEYCQSQSEITGDAFEIDHIVPEAVGGATTLDNLCLACGNCNRSKQKAQTGTDPQTAQQIPLFNPRRQNWHDHFEWIEGGTTIAGRTAIGRATIVRLKMNRPLLVRVRKRWVEAGWHPPKKD